MKLSAPIYILKQQAKALSRREKIPLHQALDRIARREGFGAWSLLAARATEDETTTVLYSQLSPGNVVLLGACRELAPSKQESTTYEPSPVCKLLILGCRLLIPDRLLGGRPGQGKTLLGIGLVIESMSRGIPSAFFTLEFTEADVARCFGILNRNLDSFRDKLLIDASDRISAAKHAGSHRLPSAIGSEERESKPYGSSGGIEALRSGASVDHRLPLPDRSAL